MLNQPLHPFVEDLTYCPYLKLPIYLSFGTCLLNRLSLMPWGGVCRRS
jgi:hypothetical protein